MIHCLWKYYPELTLEDFKLQFFCLIGGRVCNPRQQQNVVNICLLSLSARTYITYTLQTLVEQTANYQSFMQSISALKRKGVASLYQFVPWHKLSSM